MFQREKSTRDCCFCSSTATSKASNHEKGKRSSWTTTGPKCLFSVVYCGIFFFENKTPLIFFRSHCWLLFNMLFLFFNYSDWCVDRTTKMKYLVYIVTGTKIICLNSYQYWQQIYLLWKTRSCFATAHGSLEIICFFYQADGKMTVFFVPVTYVRRLDIRHNCII